MGAIGQCQICALKILQTASCVLAGEANVKRRQRERQVKCNGGQALDGKEWLGSEKLIRKTPSKGVGNI